MKAVVRQSNIELLRIVAMFFIIAYHCVCNSTLWLELDFAHPSAKSILVQLWGMWGKTGINVFVLISGYFMCVSHLTVKRYIKLLAELLFYGIVTYLVLCYLGIERVSCLAILKKLTFFHVLSRPNGGFMAGFLWMYLLIPFLNLIVMQFTAEQLRKFIFVLLIMFTGTGSIFNAHVFHHVFWYVTLYFIAASIRLHPMDWMEKNRYCVPLLLCSVMGAMGSVVAIDLLAPRFTPLLAHPYIFVADSHKIFALLVGVSAFLVFRNLKIGYHKWINTIAATVFGVFLLHTAGEGMRFLLWDRLFGLARHYTLPTGSLILYLAFVALTVFFVASCIDMLRRYVSRKLFPWFFSKTSA